MKRLALLALTTTLIACADDEAAAPPADTVQSDTALPIPDPGAADLPPADEGAPELPAEVEAPDAGHPELPDSPKEDPHPLFDVQGRVQVLTNSPPWAGGDSVPLILVDLYTAPFRPDRYVEQATDGDCSLWVVSEPTCGRSCFDWTCTGDGGCVTIDRLGAGALTFAAGEASLTLTSNPNNPGWYPLPDALPPTLFAPGAALTVSAAGSEAIPAFSVDVTSTAPLDLGDVAPIELGKAGADPVSLQWTPSGDGALVEAVLFVVHHGEPAAGYVHCAVPEDQGELVVSGDLLAAYPEPGFLGFHDISYIQRVTRELVATPTGWIEVLAGARSTLDTSWTGP